MQGAASRSCNEIDVDAHADLVEYGGRRWLIVTGVMLATLLQVLDATIVNVALPTIQGNMGANFDEAAWVVTGYIIAAVIVIPLTPWLQQLMGRRNYYVSAIVGFTITSGLCGTAVSLDQLVIYRVLQGFCGGGFYPVSNRLRHCATPGPDRHHFRPMRNTKPTKWSFVRMRQCDVHATLY